MKSISKLSILSLFVVGAAFAHSSSYTHMEQGKYEFGASYELTKGDSERENDPKKANYSYYTITNAFGLTNNLTGGFNVKYARVGLKSSTNLPSVNQTQVGHDDNFSELFLTYHKELGHDFKLSVKNSLLNIAYSKENSDLSYKMYQLGLNVEHHGHHDDGIYDGSYASISYAKGLAKKTLDDHTFDTLNLATGVNFALTNTLLLNVEGSMEFEFLKASTLKHHTEHRANAFLFNQSNKPVVSKSQIITTLEKSFATNSTAFIGFRYDIGGEESRKERGVTVGFKQII